MPMVTLLGLVGNTLAILVLHSPGVDMKVFNQNYHHLNLNWTFCWILYFILVLHWPGFNMKVFNPNSSSLDEKLFDILVKVYIFVKFIVFVKLSHCCWIFQVFSGQLSWWQMYYLYILGGAWRRGSEKVIFSDKTFCLWLQNNEHHHGHWTWEVVIISNCTEIIGCEKIEIIGRGRC